MQTSMRVSASTAAAIAACLGPNLLGRWCLPAQTRLAHPSPGAKAEWPAARTARLPHTTNSTTSPYVHGLNSFSYRDSLFTMDAPPDPRSQIPHTTNSTASPYVHGLSSFSYSDSFFTMDAPSDPRSQIPDPRSHTPQIPQRMS